MNKQWERIIFSSFSTGDEQAAWLIAAFRRQNNKVSESAVYRETFKGGFHQERPTPSVNSTEELV